jgi:flagellar L-ring protein FlgH
MTKSQIMPCAPAVALALLAVTLMARHAAAQSAVAPHAGRSFYADQRAHGPGDLLTVLIVEESSASESAQTSTSKSDGLNASLSTPARTARQWQGSLGDQFTGGGQIERSGQLLATLTVAVQSVDRNGNFRVRGEQSVKVNGERQRIELTGTVRPEDIGPDNTIPSWRIGHAHIALVGKGVLAGNQRPGLLIRFLRWLRLD